MTKRILIIKAQNDGLAMKGCENLYGIYESRTNGTVNWQIAENCELADAKKFVAVDELAELLQECVINLKDACWIYPHGLAHKVRQKLESIK